MLWAHKVTKHMFVIWQPYKNSASVLRALVTSHHGDV